MAWLFCYGSNHVEQLLERIEKTSVTTVGAWLPGYRRVFRGWSDRWGGGVASLKKDDDGVVYGYIAKVTNDDLDVLDRYEGVASGKYKRKTISVETNDGSKKAIAYVSMSTEHNSPSLKYLKACAKTVGEFWTGEGGKKVVPGDFRDNPTFNRWKRMQQWKEYYGGNLQSDAERRAALYKQRKLDSIVHLDNDNGYREDGQVLVTTSKWFADRDQSIDGSTWEAPADMDEAYTYLTDRETLADELEQAGYKLDHSRYDWTGNFTPDEE